MKNILITGGAGFIGYALSKKLIAEGFDVTILDNLSSKIHSDKSKYNSLKKISNFIIGDVCLRKDWQAALKNQDAIIHLAAETGTGQSMYEIYNYTHTNVGSTALMMDVLANNENKIKKIILSSSRAVYGEGKYFSNKNNFVYPKNRNLSNLKIGNFDFLSLNNKKLTVAPTDEDSIINPQSVYSLTKFNQEQILKLGCSSLNIQPVILRYQNVFGPGQSLSNPYTGILSIFSTRILNNNDIEIYEDGLQTRDFVYIDDIVNVTYKSLVLNNLKHNIYNVGSGVPTTVISAAKKLREIFKSNVNLKVSGRYRIGDIRNNFADLTRLKSDFNYSNFISFDEGLKSFVDWVKTQKIQKDLYDDSIKELKNKGLIR